MEGFKPKGFEKKPDMEEKEGQTTIELDEETINEISSTPKGNEFIRKIKRATAIGSIVFLSTVAGAFAQEKLSQDVDTKTVNKELAKTIGKEHKGAVISKIFNIPGEKAPAYLIQEEGEYKLVVPGTDSPGRQDIASSKARRNTASLLGTTSYTVESSIVKENKEEETITWFDTISVDDVTADKLLK